ncbi:MAG TPA: AraC family transcriptional regulator [Phycisphaerae bacterium]|nr:AraC family transcriptional regulator [Phycisphaerae bacterium]
MSTSGDFQGSDIRHRAPEPTQPADGEAFWAELSKSVAERFQRITGFVAAIRTTSEPDPQAGELVPPVSVHPLCVDPPDREHCRQSWRSHLTDLSLRPEVSWHKCKFGRFCAVVPVGWRQKCVALCHLVCPDSVGQDAFEHHVELLAVLIENFTARYGGDLTSPALVDQPAAQGPPQAGAPPGGDLKPPLHPKMSSAVDYINEHLRDSDLNAAAIARRLEMNACYLAHLFAEQVGMRMNRYIALQRVELAKRLLATTDWQIKRVARECGYANPDWFGHVFHVHAGMKPGEYRRRLGEGDPAPTSD